MKIEVLPRADGFTVLFQDGDLTTVDKIRSFSVVWLSAMGYQLGIAKVEKGSDFLFFDVRSVTESQKIKLTDLLNSLNESIKRIEKDDRPCH